MRTVPGLLSRTWAQMMVGTIVVWATLLLTSDKAPAFVYDAGQYWNGAMAVLDGRNVYLEGGLAARGAFTSVIYLPALLVSRATGGDVVADGWAVAGQNALLVALLGAVVIPLILRRVVPLRGRHIALSAVLTGVLLHGFVPYTLMDLPAVVAMALAILLLCRRRWWAALLGGSALALAMNLRPAYLVPAVLILLLLGAIDWRRSPLAVVGGAVVLAAQAAYAAAQVGVTSVLPPDSRVITEIQLTFASYVVRYDTIPYTAEDPRLWHCDPEMAAAVGNRVPTSTTSLLRLLVDTLPDSALFSLQKVAASLHWSTATPYADPGEQALHPLGLLVILTVSVGLVALACLARGRLTERAPILALLALTAGTAVTLVGSTPEARFALPLVMASLVGTVGGVARWSSHAGLSRRGLWIAAGAAVLLAALVVGAGWWGLQHDVPPENMTIDTCRVS